MKTWTTVAKFVFGFQLSVVITKTEKYNKIQIEIQIYVWL